MGREALAVMDDHLAQHGWLVADRYTIADIALFAYTHVAEDGGFTLSDYPNVCRWLNRVASHPSHVPITEE
ncbi:glutathione binding-like protein [Vreelandella zhaodongensis]|uniref:glutathione binding-like protein n=1 Tax=Vreelandella zhaodongensis TaxID=1176240 RepID=UPI003EBB1D61